MIRDNLLRLASEFPREIQKSMRGNPFLHFASNEIPKSFDEAMGYGMNYLHWKASVGLGKWSEIPWIAALDSRVTSTTQEGFYIVFLYSVDCKQLYVGMQLGTEKLRNDYGVQRSRAVMADRNAEIVSFINSAFPSHSFQVMRPDLQGKSQRTKSYEDAFSIGKRYELDTLPEEKVLRNEILSLLQMYQALVGSYLNGEALPDNVDEPALQQQSVTSLIIEKAQYKIHKSYERNSRAAGEVKRFHGYTCQACDFNFVAVYGELGSNYIEAHHLKPLSALMLGEEVKYDIKTDFAVLCSNCHRMVHRQMPPLSIAQLKKIMANRKS
jgi:5-methylcytosine-specific restriction enzyme A